MTVIFQSTIENIDISVSLIGTEREKFKDLKERLFELYPELRKKKIYFYGSGSIFKEEQTLKGNGIKNLDQIFIAESF